MSSDNTKFALTNALKLFNDNNVNSSLEQLEEILKVYPDNKEALELIISININILFNHPWIIQLTIPSK